MSCETPAPSLWGEKTPMTSGELGICLDALEMMDGELRSMEQGTGYERPKWLRELTENALRVARGKRDG